MLLTHNAQIIAVDIYEEQLKELDRNVKDTLTESFPLLITKFSKLKRNFSDKTTLVPPKYVGAFEAVNLSRVLHFLNGEQTHTMLNNIAKMMKEGGLLSLTVSTIKPGSREEKWIDSQKTLGLEDPGLVYYDTIISNTQNRILAEMDGTLPGAIKQVDRRECQLSDPSHKIEFLKEILSVSSVPAMMKILRQGRYFHTLQSIKPFLDRYFVIKDHTIYDYDGEDVFLALIAERKSIQTQAN